ncbi:MAG: glycerol kinase [Gammaproteobacteria bacterium]|nr:MAG: glycerol kinase [Gammaproteobacteria bacterium]
MSHIMAIDQGTSSSRVIIFDTQGRMLSAVQHEFDMVFPADGWVEQDPEVLWRTSLQAGRDALDKAGLQGKDVAAIGITNQRETTLVWDRNTGKTLHNAIVWQDRRTAARCADMQANGMSGEVAERTGLVIDPYFSGSKLAWLLEEVPEAARLASRGELCFGTVDTYLVWRLTKGGAHVTDATNASRTMLYDINKQSWSASMLEHFDIPENVLPEVTDSAGNFGMADPEWFGAAIPILGVAGDQQAALIGQACFEPGMVKSTYGTGCFLMTNTGRTAVRSNQKLLTTIAYQLDGEATYALEGSIFSAGVAVKWLRDQLGLITESHETEAAARRTGGDTQGVYLVPAFTGLGAPHWAPDARGVFSGMTLDTERDHLITATLASVAYQTVELVEAITADGADVGRLRVDGGMVVNDWLCQFLADMIDCTVERPVNVETTALGAAVLAAVGGELVDDLAMATRMWGLDREFQPGMEPARRERLLTGWRRAVERSLL